MILASLIPESLNNIAAVAVIASAAAFYNQIKSGLQKFFSIFIRTDTITDNCLAQDFLIEILKDSKIIRWGNSEYYYAGNDFLKKYNFYEGIIQRKDRSFFLLYKNVPIICKSVQNGLSITYLYKTFDFKSKLEKTHEKAMNRLIENTKLWEDKTTHYLIDVMGTDTKFASSVSTQDPGSVPTGSYNNKEQGEFSFHYSWLKDKGIYLNLNYGDIGQGGKIEGTNYYWSKEALKLRGEIDFFASNSKWFLDRKIPHRRGCLLYGVAGTGKSKMVLEVAKYNHIPIKRINISNMSDTEFKDNYNSSGTKRLIILIEDIDCVFDGRNNSLSKGSMTKNLLSFDTLINTISGAKETNGIFLVITTNNIDKLDPALKRAGRLDLKIEIGPLDADGRRFIASNILSGLKINLDEIVAACEGQTVAEFENYCIQTAMNYFYQNGN